MALIGSLSTVRSQLVHPAHFARAFTFIEEALRPGSAPHRQLFALAPGQSERTELPGGAFALSQAYLTKPRAEGRWETHRAHIDVQAVLAGEEFMAVDDRAKLTQAEDLTPGQDVIFYRPHEGGSVLRLGPGNVGVLFPPDAHLGALVITTPVLVRKIVVKVPVVSSAA